METLLPDIEAFVARHGIEESTFGRMVGDRHIVQQLRGGRRMWPETVERIRARMAELDAKRALDAGAPATQPPAEDATTILCAECERPATDETVRSCQFRDCPRAGRWAA